MDKIRAETLLYQIMSGYTEVFVLGRKLRVHTPTIYQKQEAANLYQRIYESTAFDLWMTDAQNKNLLVSLGYVSQDIDENFKEVQKRIEDLKVSLYESIFDSDKQEKIRNMLISVKKKYQEMIIKRHQFDSMTRHGYADLIKTQYLVASALTDDKNNLLYEDPAEASFPLLESVIHQLNISRVDEKSIRFIARSDTWRSYWQIGKDTGNLFGKPVILLSDDQRFLCQVSKMYDSAYEHPECPEDVVMADDDAFDGWMIRERRKNEQQRKEKMVDVAIKGKHKDAHEVFIVAKNAKDATNIHNLNDAHAKAIKKQRSEAIKSKGTVPDIMLPDQQQRLRIQATQQMSEAIKNSKGK